MICPVFYNSTLIKSDFENTEQVNLTEEIKKDNLILNKTENDLRIMTFNLLAHYKSWGGKPVQDRSSLFFCVLNGYAPDVLGVQEMCFDWYNEIVKANTSYKFVAPLKTAFPQKMTAILYNSDTLELLDSGTHPFSNTLNYMSRRVVWGLFKHKSTNNVFYVINTHLSFLEEYEESENFNVLSCQVNELYSTVQTLYTQYTFPVFTIGDFNTKRRAKYQNNDIPSGAYGILNSWFTDAETISENKYFCENTNFQRTLNDHIFIKGDVFVKNVYLVSKNELSMLSDHYPLFVDVRISKLYTNRF